MIDLSDRQVYVLSSEFDRGTALYAVRKARLGLAVTIDRPQRTDLQNRRLWAMLQAISDAGTSWAGETWEPDDWLTLMTSAFYRIKGRETGRVIRGLEGEPVVVGRRSSVLNTKEFAELCDMVVAFIDTNGVPWPERERGR